MNNSGFKEATYVPPTESGLLTFHEGEEVPPTIFLGDIVFKDGDRLRRPKIMGFFPGYGFVPEIPGEYWSAMETKEAKGCETEVLCGKAFVITQEEIDGLKSQMEGK